MGINGFVFKKNNKSLNNKEIKESWEPYRICLLNSTANPVNFHPNWTTDYNGLCTVSLFAPKLS